LKYPNFNGSCDVFLTLPHEVNPKNKQMLNLTQPFYCNFSTCAVVKIWLITLKSQKTAMI